MTEHAWDEVPADTAVDDAFVDGSAVAGELQELFATDMTTAVGTCGACGQAAVLARARVYHRAPGLVLRCAGCAHVLARIVRTADHVVLDLSGLRSILVGRPG